jgi:hypothetical protein
VSRPLGPSAPTIGRIVHIADDQHGSVPAIVSKVIDLQTVIAHAFYPDRDGSLRVTAEHVEPAPGLPNPPAGTWHWPPIR